MFTGSEEFLAFAKALAENNLATIHAEPVLATQSGRPASLEIGSLRVEATPTVLRDHRIRFEYGVTVPLSSSPPAANPVFTCESSVALEAGKACVITLPMPRPPDAAGKPSETEMLVIARASLGAPERLSGREPGSTASPQSR